MSSTNVSVGTIYSFYRTWTATWDTTRTTGSSSSVATNAGCQTMVVRGTDTNQFQITRGVMAFDTSAIPANSTISAVTLYWYRKLEKNQQPGVSATTVFCPVSETGANVAYYNRSYFGSSVGTLACYYSNPSNGGTVNAWANLSLTTTCITKAGTTLIGAMQGQDYSDIDPGGSDKYNQMASDTIAGNNSYLTIVWTTPPVVTTGAVTDLKSVTATLGGNVTDAGGGTVSERGVCWATTENPTTASSKATAAGTSGAYTVGATGLIAGTLYHYRAYVTTENSTTYGTDLTFRTINGGNFIPFL